MIALARIASRLRGASTVRRVALARSKLHSRATDGSSFRRRIFRLFTDKDRRMSISEFLGSRAGEPIRVLNPVCGHGEFINSCSAGQCWAADLGLNGSKIDSMLKFERGSFSDLDFPNDHFDLTHIAVEEHLHTAGFEIRRAVPRFLPYSFRSRLLAWHWTTNAYLKYLPVWRLLDKQVLKVANRSDCDR